MFEGQDISKLDFYSLLEEDMQGILFFDFSVWNYLTLCTGIHSHDTKNLDCQIKLTQLRLDAMVCIVITTLKATFRVYFNINFAKQPSWYIVYNSLDKKKFFKCYCFGSLYKCCFNHRKN